MSGTPLRIGVVGAGAMARKHLPYLLALGAEVLVYSEQGAQELVDKHGGTVVASFADLLRQVDVIDIATPTYTHFELAEQALAAGKDIICEKPVTRTDEEATRLLDLVATTGQQIFPGHVVRYFPEYVRLKAAVDANLLGELAVLRFSRSGAFPTRSAWFAERDLSGGIIMDQMIHDLDMARWIAGDVRTVSAVTNRAGTSKSPVEAAHVLLTHESGAISHIAGLWGPSHITFTTDYSVTGTLGTLAHSSLDETNYVPDFAQTTGGGGLTPADDPAESPYFLELQDFVTALRGGSTPRVSLQDGAIAVRIANAALLSLETGQPVHLTTERSAA